MTTFTLKQLQEEHVPWVVKNFGDNRDPLTGVVEEVGEFVAALEAYNSFVQAIADGVSGAARALLEKGRDEAITEVRDGAGDIAIYMSDCCALFCLSFEKVVRDARERNEERPDGYADGMRLLGALSHAKLKMQQGIRGRAEDHVNAFAAALGRFYLWVEAMLPVELFDGETTPVYENFLAVIEEVWGRVKQRDWTKNKTTGAAK